MFRTLALSETFWKGVAVTVAALILFVGSVYLVLSAVFGLRMGYLVLAVSLFGWMIILSALWVFGATFFGAGTPVNQGPRGTEPHWQVFAAGTGPVESSTYAQTATWPDAPWREQTAATTSSADTVKTTIQSYMAAQANRELGEPPSPSPGEESTAFEADPTLFVVQDIRFATADDGTFLSSGVSFYQQGGPAVVVFLYHDRGNVPAYSWAFFLGSIFLFGVHLPFLDRAEKKRKEILTGGAAPPWYGPA
jgi:hypothetical protein